MNLRSFQSIHLLVCAFLAGVASARGDDLPNSPRVTPLVRVIHGIESSVVALFCVTSPTDMVSGSGAVVHPDGFVLTNNHVLPTANGYALLGDRRRLRFDVVGRLPEQDLAIVQLRSVSELKPIPLGHSHDLLNGEPVVVAGNPGGRGIVYTSGIVSAAKFLSGGPNALVISQFHNSDRETFIQFDAASNRGNSGGPLVNMEGRLIGIVSGWVPDEQNTGLAIPIDRARKFFNRVVDPEVRHAKRTGLDVVTTGEHTIVRAVIKTSPAAKCGLQPRDVIVSLNQKPVGQSLDWLVNLHSVLKAGDDLEIGVERLGEQMTFRLEPHEWNYSAAVQPEKTKSGLRFRLYEGNYQSLPEFDTLTPVHEGVASSIEIDAIRRGRDFHFAVQLDGLMQVSEDGLYRLIVASDDGSRIFVDHELAINHDGSHPRKEASRLLRLGKGPHPLSIEYFQGIGGKALELYIEDESGKRQPVDAAMLFHSEQRGSN